MSRFGFAVLVTGVLTAQAASACPAISLQKTFLDVLPPSALQRPVSGRVIILSQQRTLTGMAVTAQVAQPIRNLRTGQTFMAQLNDCSIDLRYIAPGKAYFVAGSLTDSGVFSGPWSAASKAPDAPGL